MLSQHSKCLTAEQTEEIRREMVPSPAATPVRFLVHGQALQIGTGALSSKGSNVIYHPVYWNFTKETAKKIAGWLDAVAVFSQ